MLTSLIWHHNASVSRVDFDQQIKNLHHNPDENQVVTT